MINYGTNANGVPLSNIREDGKSKYDGIKFVTHILTAVLLPISLILLSVVAIFGLPNSFPNVMGQVQPAHVMSFNDLNDDARLAAQTLLKQTSPLQPLLGSAGSGRCSAFRININLVATRSELALNTQRHYGVPLFTLTTGFRPHKP